MNGRVLSRQRGSLALRLHTNRCTRMLMRQVGTAISSNGPRNKSPQLPRRRWRKSAVGAPLFVLTLICRAQGCKECCVKPKLKSRQVLIWETTSDTPTAKQCNRLQIVATSSHLSRQESSMLLQLLSHLSARACQHGAELLAVLSSNEPIHFTISYSRGRKNRFPRLY